MPSVELLSEETRSALQAAKVVGPFLYPPREMSSEVERQLERVLLGLRGTKNTRERAFIFPGDPSGLIEQVLVRNEVPRRNPLSFFWTSKPVMSQILEKDPIAGVERVLEPTAGDGTMIEGLKECYPQAYIDCGELDPYRRALLQQHGHHVVCENILNYFPEPTQRYDRICGNPPFTSPTDPILWMRIIDHLWRFCLLPGGSLSSITANLLRREWRTKEFLAFVEQHGSYELLGSEAFRHAGAHVATAIIHLQKPLDWVESGSPLPFLAEEKPEQRQARATPVQKRGTSRRRQPTAEELELAEQKRESVRGWLTWGAKALFDELQHEGSEQLNAWVSVASRFCWKYSAWNILLVRYQYPDATQLEGVATWRKRYQHRVRMGKGERGISIQTPLPWKREGEDGTLEEGLGFRVKAVFNVTQVEPIPAEEQRDESEGKPAFDEAEDGQLRLPVLPYIVEEHVEDSCMEIEQTVVGLIPQASHDLQQQQMRAIRAQFVTTLVRQYYQLPATFPQSYHATWKQEIAGPQTLMQELETIRKVAAEVIRSLEGRSTPAEQEMV